MLSIVVTVHGCAGALDELFARTRAVVDQEGWRAEWVFVDDASTDGAWQTLAALSRQDGRVRSVRNARNLGQHRTILAGLASARGTLTAVMDGDLQDPPEDLPRLVAAVRSGSEVAIATYGERRQPRWRRWGSRIYFLILGVPDIGERRLSVFSVMSERARQAFLRAPNAGHAYLLVLFDLKLPVAFIPSRKDPRATGVSSYRPWQLVRIAVRNILLFRPGRLAALLACLAFGALVASAAVWGLRPAGGIWLGSCAALAAVLFAIRYYMSTPGSSE